MEFARLRWRQQKVEVTRGEFNLSVNAAIGDFYEK